MIHGLLLLIVLVKTIEFLHCVWNWAVIYMHVQRTGTDNDVLLETIENTNSSENECKRPKPEKVITVSIR